MWPGAKAHRGQRTGHASEGSPGTWEAPHVKAQHAGGDRMNNTLAVARALGATERRRAQSGNRRAREDRSASGT